MSADLFAEFGNVSSTSQDRREVDSRRSLFDIDALVSDLEVNDRTSSVATHSGPAQPSRATLTTNWPDELTTVADVSRHTQLEFDQPRQADGTTVLFDASLENVSDEDGDDWGEFEQPATEIEGKSEAADDKKAVVATSRSQVRSETTEPSPAYVDLLGLDSVNDNVSSKQQAPVSENYMQRHTSLQASDLNFSAPHSGSQPDEAWEDWADIVNTPTGASSPQRSKSKLHQAATTNPTRQGPKSESDQPRRTESAGDDWDDWGEFVDESAANPDVGRRQPELHQAAEHTSTAMQRPNEETAQESQREIAIFAAATSTSPDQVRPTNIPPPSVLLELFPRLFEQLQDDISEIKRSATSKAPLQNLADRSTRVLKVAARLVAGRTLRWKRDSILSQSMRIGPARSGKPGGMKLNTVNKTENVREQQQTIELLTTWRDKAAFFNSFLASAGRRPVQAVTENIRATTATVAQGALKARHACALCGLKRDERLPRVDETVEDSFGEWWTDHWGHTDCKLFWENNQHLLDQR